MVFYASWLDAIKNLPREMQGEVLTAIIEYGLSGETTASLKPITKAMLALVKAQIDINNKRYENSLKGGRKREEDGNEGNQVQTKPEPSANQTETKVKPNPNQVQTKPEPNNVNVNDNDNDNDKEIVSTNVEPIKKGTNVPKENTHTPSERYAKFTQLLGKDCPYISSHYSHLISEDEFDRLMEKFTAKDVWDTIQQIENRVDLRKKYTNLYRTLLNWLKRDNIPKT